MSLLRAAARPMLASYFIVSGFKALKDPQPLVSDAEPVADRMIPLVKSVAPDSVTGMIPDDTATLVRINGALQLGGGLALATGKGRRLGALLLAASLVPSTVARHPFWSRDTPEEKAEDRSHFLKNVSLLGGVLLASADTEGKPSIAWRAQAGSDRVARKGRKAGRKAKRALSSNSNSLVDSVSKTGHELSENTQQLAGAAVAGGLGILHEVEKQTRRSRKKAKKRAKKLAEQAAEQAKEAQALAQKQAKRAKKEAPKKAREAQKTAAKQLEAAKEAAQKQAKEAQKQARSSAKDAKKGAGKLADNIQLGSN